MSVINAVPLLAAAGGDYTISRSVRLRSSASAYFSRTFASAGNRKTWTWSAWVKRGSLGGNLTLFSSGSGSAIDTNWLGFVSSDSLSYSIQDGTYYLATTQVFRDPSAWYHIVLATDTTQATASNRAKMYINGVQVTAFSTATYATQNLDQVIGAANLTTVGAKYRTAVQDYFDGYITEVNFIDGQALTPSSFGETDSITGVWKPKKYSGTYGTNGFYLNFSDNSNNTAATIGKDSSGNGNNWTPNNISVTSGSTYDSMLDVPTPYADGDNGRGNYAVLNPLSLGSTVTLSNGNLTMTEVGTYATTVSSIAMTSGKWYAEMTVGSNTYAGTCGIAKLGYAATSRLGFQANTWAYNSDGGLYYNSTQLTPTQATFTTGDVIGIAFDADNLTIQFYKNNTLQSQYYTAANSGLTAGEFYFATGHINSTSNWNFGQRPFAYTPPSGFKALNTQNLPTPTISNGALYMAATTYTGNGGTQSIANTVNGVSFKPDLVWVKGRSVAYNNYLEDSVRGVGKDLSSNLTDAEATYNLLSSFNSNGFTVFTNGTYLASNENGTTYVGWQWQAGQGSTSSNTNGSITSTVSVNATAGFSVVTYTGIAGNVAKTFGHGLGVAPSMVIVKGRDAGSTGVNDWVVWHSAFTGSEYIYLDLTNAKATSANYWGATVPSSTVVTVGGNSSNVSNESGIKYVAYCFAEVAGFSRMGSYQGNGSSEGPFVFCGFRPRWVMVKRTDSTSGWTIFDTSRSPSNVTAVEIYANASDAEASGNNLDINSNGFKCRTTNTWINASGGTYVYAAFAENPFKLSLAR